MRTFGLATGLRRPGVDMARGADNLDARVLQLIRRSRRRVITSRCITALIDISFFCLLALVAIGTLSESVNLGPTGWAVFLALLSLCSVAYLVGAALSGTSMRAVAILLDERLGFHDRVSSSLIFAGRRTRTPFMEAHLAETVTFLEKRVDRALPFPPLRRGRHLALLLVVSLASLLPHADRTSLEKRDRIEKRGRKVERVRSLARELDQLRKEADLRGLKKLSRMIAAVEEELSRQVELVTAEDLQPPPPEEENPDDPKKKPDQTADHDSSGDDRVRPDGEGLASGETGEGVRLSSVATYQPVGKFDSYPEQVYTEVFAELDSAILDDQLNARELTKLAAQLEKASGMINNYGTMEDTSVTNTERGMLGPEGEEIQNAASLSSFERALAPLQYKSFSEFLKRYAAHMGEKALGRAKFELSKQENDGGEMFNVSAPPPKDASFALRATSDRPSPDMPILQGSQEQMGDAASQAAQGKASGAAKAGGESDGTQPGGAGAGAGSPVRTGAAPPVLPRANGGEYLPLKGKLGDGKAVIQIINDRGKRQLASRPVGSVTYRDVFVEYAQGAEAELNSEQVPLHMREYIRDYFRSIRPGLDD